MFKDEAGRPAFVAVIITYMLDLIGFSIVIPVFAPLLLDPDLHYFSPGTSEVFKTTMIGLTFALFGLAQFFAAPPLGAAADHYGRRKIFLWTVGVSVIGYALIAYGVWLESLTLLFIGRIWTGTCSGNISLAQSAIADITKPESRAKAFGYLIGIGGLGFLFGPWIGGILANPTWLHGSVPFLFVSAVAILNVIILWLFFRETHKPQKRMARFGQNLRDLRHCFTMRPLRRYLMIYFLFLMGWGFYLFFSPTYFVQRFDLSTNVIGDLYAYLQIFWIIVTLWVNKELIKHFSLRKLALWGSVITGVGLILILLSPSPWLYLIIIPPMVLGTASVWVDTTALISHAAPSDYQGRALGAGASLLSLSQVIVSLVAGPLAGWNLYIPLSIGSLLCFVTAACLMKPDVERKNSALS